MSHGHSRGHTSQQGKRRASNYDVEDGRSMKCCPGHEALGSWEPPEPQVASPRPQGAPRASWADPGANSEAGLTQAHVSLGGAGCLHPP